MSYISDPQLKKIIINSLKEDIGKRDITTDLVIPENKTVDAVLLAKEEFVLCGLKLAEEVFKIKDRKIKFKSLLKDGRSVKKGKVIARIQGRATSILSAERVALNFLSLLSGIATKTRKYVEAVKPYRVKIIDTRKTIPGLRILQKYAVRIGGGCNHRMSLDEMVMVKDNHLQVTAGYLHLPKLTHNYRIELEVGNIKELRQALKLKPDIIMLDNMSIADMKKAVKIRNNPTPKLEASGGITLKNIKKIAACGVDMISVGALTHSVDSVDISLEIL